MKVNSIEKMLYSSGRGVGIPCIHVNLWSGSDDEKVEDMDLNSIITKILNFSKLRTVQISGLLSKIPEIKTLIEGLVQKNKQVVFMTPANEDIGPVRSLQKVKFSLYFKPPTKDLNTVRLANLPLLKEEDDLDILIGDMTEYENAKKFLKSKVITRPTILFDFGGAEDRNEILTKYLQDCETFTFNSRYNQILDVFNK